MKFGDFVKIEQLRYGGSNEHYLHKVIAVLQSNSYVDVPVRLPRKERLHEEMVYVVACVCCGVSEREILNYPITKVEQVLKDGHEKLVEMLIKAEKAAHFINSAYSGCPTSKKVEKLLMMALNELAPIREYFYQSH